MRRRSVSRKPCIRAAGLLAAGLLSSIAAAQTDESAGIQPESMGKIETLPEQWPDHWVLAQDASFFHMSDGKFIVLDVEAESVPTQLKGFFNGSKIAQMTQSTTKPEIYVAETFLSRGQRGERTDVLTIIDKSTLAPVGEVVIPPKRISQIPTQYAVQLTDNETKALVLNFTPATSITVVDLPNKAVLGEVPIGGCSGVYATGKNGFSSLCADGTIYSIALDGDGKKASEKYSEKFFDIDEDALFERAAMIDGTGYFPTFLGSVVPIDLSGKAAKVGKRWSLLGEEDSGWRPGGIQVAASDDAGRLYVLMHPEGAEGTHKDPGTEIWVFDVDQRKRVARLPLKLPALTFTVGRGDDPYLVTTNVELTLDVYSARTGDYRKTLSDFGAETALALHPAH